MGADGGVAELVETGSVGRGDRSDDGLGAGWLGRSADKSGGLGGAVAICSGVGDEEDDGTEALDAAVGREAIAGKRGIKGVAAGWLAGRGDVGAEG